MSQRPVSAIKKTGYCKDELNLAEFPLCVIGTRPPKGVKTLVFEDSIEHPDTGEPVARTLTITGSDLLGLPTSMDEQVLMGCLRLTSNQRDRQQKIPFTAYQFLEEIGWSRDGRSYRRLSESLDRWAGVLVLSNNAFWHKGKQCVVKDTFGLIDRWKLIDERDEKRNANGWFVWGDLIWESIEAGYLRTIDYELWKSLESPVAKRLYRLLGKRFYKRRVVSFPLKTLAHDKVGISRNQHTGQVKNCLQKGHQELERNGFCRSEFIRRSRGNWDVVYTRIDKPTKALPAADENSRLLQALEERGIQNAKELLRKQPLRSRIEKAIENFDDRIAHGEKLTSRWLASDILHETGFSYRHGYRCRADREADTKAKQEVVEDSRREQERRQRRKDLQDQRLRKRFDQFLATLIDPLQKQEFFDRSLEAFPLYRDLLNNRPKTSDESRTSRHQRDAMFLYWKQLNGL